MAKVVLATPAPVTHRTAEENLGLGYLAAILRQKGIEVEIIDGWLEGLTPEELAQRILKVTPTPIFVGFSAYQSNMHKATETIEHLRKNKFKPKIIAGGFGPTFHPNEFLDSGFDIVVRGEAEQIIVKLAEELSRTEPDLSSISNIGYVNGDSEKAFNKLAPLETNIDQFPLPARDTLDLALKIKTPIHVLTSRGCAAHCLFCSIVSFQRLASGPQWRQRSIPKIVDEIESLYQQGATHFKLIDDSLIEPPRGIEWCKDFADEIEKRKLSVYLRSSIRADRVTDEVLFHLKRAGFFSFSCGIENFSEAALARMAKTATLPQNIKALELFKKHDIYVQAGHILFDPQTSMPELWENFHLMKRFKWTISKGIFTEMYAAEGTPFTRLVDKKGLKVDEHHHLGNYRYRLLDPQAQIAHAAMKEWHKTHMGFYDKAIDPLSAPKSLNHAELRAFHEVYEQIRDIDFEIMEGILSRISVRDSASEEVHQYITTQKEEKRGPLSRLAQKVDALYAQVGLVYDAQENPFVRDINSQPPISIQPRTQVIA